MAVEASAYANPAPPQISTREHESSSLQMQRTSIGFHPGPLLRMPDNFIYYNHLRRILRGIIQGFDRFTGTRRDRRINGPGPMFVENEAVSQYVRG